MLSMELYINCIALAIEPFLGLAIEQACAGLVEGAPASEGSSVVGVP